MSMEVCHECGDGFSETCISRYGKSFCSDKCVKHYEKTRNLEEEIRKNKSAINRLLEDNERIKKHGVDPGFRVIIPEKTFRLHQDYEKPGSVKQLQCCRCNETLLEVGQGNYFTVVRCPKCGYEECIHDG